MKFTKTGDFTARAYCDADYNGSADERLSTTAYIIFLGACPLDASSRCQKFSARSVGEAEFGSLSACVAEILFHRQLLNAKNLQQQAITILAPKEAEDVLRNAKEESSVEAIVYSDSTTAIANGNLPVGWLSNFKTFVSQCLRTRHLWNYAEDARPTRSRCQVPTSEISGRQMRQKTGRYEHMLVSNYLCFKNPVRLRRPINLRCKTTATATERRWQPR